MLRHPRTAAPRSCLCSPDADLGCRHVLWGLSCACSHHRARMRVLRVLRRERRHHAVQRRHAGRADARRHAHRAGDAERLQGAARGLRDGRAGAGRAPRRRHRRSCRRTCSTTSTRWARRGSSSTGNRTRCGDRFAPQRIAKPATAGAMSRPMPTPPAAGDYGVTVEAQFVVGEYQVVILSAKESTGLDSYLRDNHYKIPEGAEPLLRPYVETGMKFFVAKVDPSKVTFQNGHAALSPLRFHYDSDDFTLPIRLGLANSDGTQDLIISIFAKQLALRGRQLQERVHPDQPRHRRLDPGQVRRVLRDAVRRHGDEEPGRGGDRVCVAGDQLRPVPGSDAAARRAQPAGLGRAVGQQRLGGRRAGGDHAAPGGRPDDGGERHRGGDHHRRDRTASCGRGPGCSPPATRRSWFTRRTSPASWSRTSRSTAMGS